MEKYIQIAKDGKPLRMKLNSAVNILSRLFKYTEESIYLIGDESIVFPDPVSRTFNEDEILNYVTYEVFGDPVNPAPSEPTTTSPMGNPFSYQSPTSTAKQFANYRQPYLQPSRGSNRPTLPTRPSYTRAEGIPKQQATWKKAVMFCEIVDGKPSAVYQIHATLTDSTASVETIAKICQQEVGEPVMLLDNKFLKIISSEATKGMCHMWLSLWGYCMQHSRVA